MRQTVVGCGMKPYYLLHEALYQAKEHDMEFDFYDCEIGGNRTKQIYRSILCYDVEHLDALSTYFYPSDLSILEPRQGDVIGISPFPELPSFRNGKAFLPPNYEVKND